MRMTHSLEDFNLCEQVVCGCLVQSLLPNHLHRHYLSTVPLQCHSQELNLNFTFSFKDKTRINL